MCGQVADALDDAHRAGIVHRDVKPTNVLVRDREADEPHVYLCDFGIARTGTDGLTAAGAVAGTWSYLAPENGRGVPATASSDLYAVGCLLWAALTGHPPYRGTDVEIALAHQRDPVPQLPGDSPLVARGQRDPRPRRWPRTPPTATPTPAPCAPPWSPPPTLPGADEALPAEVARPDRAAAHRRPPGLAAAEPLEPLESLAPAVATALGAAVVPLAPRPSHPPTPGFQSASYPPQPSPGRSGSGSAAPPAVARAASWSPRSPRWCWSAAAPRPCVARHRRRRAVRRHQRGADHGRQLRHRRHPTARGGTDAGTDGAPVDRPARSPATSTATGSAT